MAVCILVFVASRSLVLRSYSIMGGAFSCFISLFFFFFGSFPLIFF